MEGVRVSLAAWGKENPGSPDGSSAAALCSAPAEAEADEAMPGAALGWDSQGWATGELAAAWEAAEEADEARTGAGWGRDSQGLFTGEKLMRRGPGWSGRGGLSKGVWVLGWSRSLQALAASLRMVDCGVPGASLACTRACRSGGSLATLGEP